MLLRVPSVPRWLERIVALPSVRLTLALSLLYLVTLNGIVRCVGHGDAWLLSVLHVPDKSYAVFSLGLHSVKHVWSSHDEDPRAIVMQAARSADVPSELALSIARTESSFAPHSISCTGAMGMMQLMPATALSHGVTDPFDPAQSAAGAMRFLHELLQRYHGDRVRTAAAYNAGAGRVPRAGPLDKLPNETRIYVSRVVPQR